jgi:hypothetical protein
VDNAGVWQVNGTGTATFNNLIPFNNYGTVQIQSGTLAINSTFVQIAGLTALKGGNLNVSQPFQLQGGVLAGTNTITGDVQSSGIVSPGASPGRLTIIGNYTQNSNGALQIELAGNSPGTGYDQLIVSNTATISGALNVTLTNGFHPALANTFTVLSAGSLSGRFGSFVYDTNAFGLTLTNTANAAILTVTNTTFGSFALAALPVLTPQISGSSFSLSFQSFNGKSYTVYYNDNMATTNWLPYTTITGNGGMVQLPVPVTNASRFFRISSP